MQRIFRSGGRKKISAWIGASVTQIETGIPGLLYARLNNGQVITIINSIAPAVFNYPVKIARNSSGAWEVVELRQAYSVPLPLSNFHHGQHEYPGPDVVNVRDAQFLPFVVLPNSGFTVSIFGGIFKLGGVRYLLQNQTLDLSASQPAAGAIWVLIEVDSTGALNVVAGTEVEGKELLTVDNIPDNSAGGWDLCAIRLYAGQTSIQRDPRDNNTNDFVDLRFGRATHSSQNIMLSRLGTTVQRDLQFMQSVIHSAGWVSGGDITDNADGSIGVAAGIGLLRATDDNTDELFFCDWEEDATVSLTDDSINWVCIAYNAGDPQIDVVTSEPTDFNTRFCLAKIYRNGTELHINGTIRHTVGDHASLMMRNMMETMPFAWVTGGMISEVGTRQFAITEGAWWNGLTRFITAAFDGTSDTFNMYYRDGAGGWTEVLAETAINNTQYDDGDGGLGTLTAAHYGVHWVYLATDNDIHCVLGQGNYILADAQAAEPPESIPPELETDSRIIGKIIILKSASAFTSIESLITMGGSSPSSSVDHNDLAGLQGGTTNEYYHLTSAQNTNLPAAGVNVGRIYFSASAPTANDDSGDGYREGDLWARTTFGITQIYYLSDDTVGAAVWREISYLGHVHNMPDVTGVMNFRRRSWIGI
jgi:hypothetical protein